MSLAYLSKVAAFARLKMLSRLLNRYSPGRRRDVIFMRLIAVVGVMSLISGCVSVDSLVAQNSIRVGMTKSDVANVILWQGSVEDDPWLSGCYYEHIRETYCEILSGSGRNQYLVFCGAYIPSGCGTREGSSTLKGVYRTYNEAKRSASPAPAPAPAYIPPVRAERQSSAPRSVPAPAPIDERASATKIQHCIKRGLTPGSPEFKRCFAEK